MIALVLALVLVLTLALALALVPVPLNKETLSLPSQQYTHILDHTPPPPRGHFDIATSLSLSNHRWQLSIVTHRLERLDDIWTKRALGQIALILTLVLVLVLVLLVLALALVLVRV